MIIKCFKKAIYLLPIIILSVVACSIFTGCYDRKEVDDLAYAYAIGVDKGKNQLVKITLQIAAPKSTGQSDSSGGGGQGGGSKGVFNVTAESQSTYPSLTMINSAVSRQINISHAKVIVFSREFAQSGNMIKCLNAMSRDRQFRPDMYIVISQGSAEEYLKSVDPVAPINPFRYYEFNLSSYKYTSFFANSQMQPFYNNIKSTSRQAIATIVGVNKNNTSQHDGPKSAESQDKDSNAMPSHQRDEPYLNADNYIAGDVPVKYQNKSQAMGLAVFDAGNMVGELNGKEVMFYLMSSGEYGYSYITIPDPKSKGDFVVMSISQRSSPHYNVSIINEKPVIDLMVNLEGDYVCIQSGINYELGMNTPIIEKAAGDILKQGITEFLYKTSKQFHSDIVGFGRFAKIKFWTWEKWQQFNWLSKYKDATFNVNVDFHIRKPGLIIRTADMVGSSGKEPVKE